MPVCKGKKYIVGVRAFFTADIGLYERLGVTDGSDLFKCPSKICHLDLRCFSESKKDPEMTEL